MNWNYSFEETAIVLEKIGAPASRQSLLSFISWLDNECIATEVLTSLPYQILARSIVAVGYKKILHEGTKETILKTIKSGENYAMNPTEQQWDQFFDCATMSFPFGPGEGCYSIPELKNGPSCNPGSGCISGAGSLACLGLNEVEVMTTLAEELIPWIMGKNDPILSRTGQV